VDGVNKEFEGSLELEHIGNGVYSYYNDQFFPLDHTPNSFGREMSHAPQHNFHFTMEIHSNFLYAGGETFNFTGDDDVWVFINGHLVIDLGGVHAELVQNIKFDEDGNVVNSTFGIIPGLKLQKGQVYDFDLFFAERHTTQSNFKMQTSLKFAQSEVNHMNVLGRKAGTTDEFKEYVGAYIGDELDLLYEIPEQKMNLGMNPLNKIDPQSAKIQTNFSSILPEGLELVGIYDDKGNLNQTFVNQDDQSLTKLSGTIDGFGVQFIPNDNSYLLAKTKIMIRARMVGQTDTRMKKETTSGNYQITYNYQMTSLFKTGKLLVKNDFKVNLLQFNVKIDGETNLPLGMSTQLTAKPTWEGMKDPVFIWTEETDGVKIIEPPQIIDGKSVVKVRFTKPGLETIKVTVYPRDYSDQAVDDYFVVQLTQEIDIG
jgi:fibro-slime domain-containing protein